MATAMATHTNGKAKSRSFAELMAERRRRAEQGLARGEYRVEERTRADGAWTWTVHGPNGNYTVSAHKEEGRWRWQCGCEDFQRHADAPNWKCKHIHMVRLWHEQQKARANGKAAHKADGVNGRVKAAQVVRPAALKRLSDRDFRAALNYAVEVIESGQVKRDGPNAWVIRDRDEEVRVQGNGHTWTCSVCDGECRHTVTAQVLDIMQTHGFWAPLPATRILEARQKPEMKPGRAEAPSGREPVTVVGSGGTELIRVLGEMVEQLQELNQNLRAIEKSMEQYLGEVVDATKAMSDMVAGIPDALEGLGNQLVDIADVLETATRKDC